MSLRVCSTNSACFSFIQEQKTPTVFLAAFVFAAGAATAGVALAGFIPFNYLYVGIGVIAIDLVFSAVLLATLFCHQKKIRSTDEQEANPISDVQVEEEKHITEEDPVSEEKSVTEKEHVSEKEKNFSKKTGKATGKLSTYWMPDELLVNIFSFLNPNEVGKALFVSKHWNQCAKSDVLWRERIHALGWKEDQPKCFEAWRSLHAMKNNKSTLQCFSIKMAIGSDFASQGNHLAIYSSNNGTLNFWEIKQNKLNQKASISLQNMTVEGLSVFCEKVNIYDTIGDKMGTMLQWDVLTGAKTEVKADLLWHERGAPIYKNNYICVDHFYEYSKEIIVFAVDIQTKKRHIITQLNLPKIKNPAMDSFPIETVHVISDGVLLIQSLFGEEPKNGYPIWRLDLDAKKWLPELKPGDSFRLVSAVAGLVITQNKNKTNVWDYR